MFKPILTPRDIAERYHRFLPEEIRSYLKGRGIPATLIDRQLLGWDGKRIRIPIFGRTPGEVLGFRYAKPPALLFGAPEMESDEKLGPELYGWETLARQPHRVVICEGEFDRLVLEARGFPAVCSAAGAATFLEEWVPYFGEIKHVFLCFNRSAASNGATKKVQQVLPSARIAKLPADVDEGGTVTDFFVTLERTQLDFEIILAAAAAAEGNPDDRPPQVREFRPVHRTLRRRAERIRNAVPLHEVVSQLTHLQAGDGHLVGHCPFHDDGSLSFSVYPQTDTYACSVCRAEGDVVKFLMDKESMTFGQALEALERFEFTHELYGTGS
jgi:DNA primase